MLLSELELLFLKPLWSISDFCFPQAPWIIEGKSPPENWPSKGELEFVNYSVRYRKGLDLVLKGLNLQVHGGEKVSYQLKVCWNFALCLQWQLWSRGEGLEEHWCQCRRQQWPVLSMCQHPPGWKAAEGIAWDFLHFQFIWQQAPVHHVGGSSTSDKNSVTRMLFWSNVDGRRNSSFFWSLTSPVKFLAWKEMTFFVSLIRKLSLFWEIHFFMLRWKVLRFACWRQNN